MSDTKFCSSCGTSLSASAVFCHGCGQKQNVTPNPEPEAEAVVPETANPSTFEQEMPAEASLPVENKVEEIEVQAAEAPKAEPQAAPPPVFQAKQPDPYVQPAMQAEPQPASRPAAPQPQQTPVNTYQQQYQQPYYPQTPAAQPAPAPKKKRFPWFFTVMWLVALSAIGIWAYFIFIHEAYPKPVFTEDAQRIAIFLGSAFVLIYTLSLKLSMKKLKVLPTIILILAALVGFYLFSMIELVEGDWLHDALSDITKNVLPTSGE